MNDPAFSEIEAHWQSMPFKQCITSDMPLGRQINGLYALKHPRYGWIYIGKGKPISGRIKSHYSATQGLEKSPKWKQFFEYMTDDQLMVYWYEADYEDGFRGEKIREILECLLHIRYKPLFETLYKKGMRKELPDIEQAVKEVFTGKYT